MPRYPMSVVGLGLGYCSAAVENNFCICMCSSYTRMGRAVSTSRWTWPDVLECHTGSVLLGNFCFWGPSHSTAQPILAGSR